MKSIFRVLLVVAGLLCLTWSIASAQNSAPDGVNEILEQMGEFEESFESDNWDEAAEIVEKINTELKQVFAESKLDDFTLEKSLATLEHSVKDKHRERTDANFIMFQKQFFNFISHFDYEIHPILEMIEKYVVDEAGEAAEKNELGEVASEMAEAANLIDHARPLLVEKGISEQEVDDFKKKVIDVIKAAKSDDAAQMNTVLKEVQDIYASFIDRYKGA